jgi:hypothetical protein
MYYYETSHSLIYSTSLARTCINITGIADDQLQNDYDGSNIILLNVITLILNTPLLPLLQIIFVVTIVICMLLQLCVSILCLHPDPDAVRIALKQHISLTAIFPTFSEENLCACKEIKETNER